MKKNLLALFILMAVCLELMACGKVADNKWRNKYEVTLSSLLDELVSYESVTLFPYPYYTQKQVSSYDRRSVSPDAFGWFANDDGYGFERSEINGGRTEKVLFDEEGPGVITRIWMTTTEKNGTLRFYFDNEQEASVVLDGYDMKFFPLNIAEGLSFTHTNYDHSNKRGKGGNTFFLPLPYAKRCKITLEEWYDKPLPRYYGINFRTYEHNVKVKTFSLKDAEALASKIELTSSTLLNPPAYGSGVQVGKTSDLPAGKQMSVDMPSGEKAVREMKISVSGASEESFSEAMSGLFLQMEFDGVQTINVPVSDFCGAGIGAPKVKSWYMDSEGTGNICCRWPMPYKSGARLRIINTGNHNVSVTAQVQVSEWNWNENTLYFHCNWRFEEGIPLSNHYGEMDNLDWNFATLNGRGVYMGDLLSLYNHSPAWYGEGDEKMWVDDDVFPSHFGTGTEDYYNSSWAPVVPFDTPFGGAPRADNDTSHGYNAFMRTRNLDRIPFSKSLRFDIEMLSWAPGVADYYTTVFWYGDIDATAKGAVK